MATSTKSNTSIHDRLNHISSRLIIMSLNIHIELNDGRFSSSCSKEIRKYSDLSLVSSSLSSTYIDELFTAIEYYCHEINQLANALRPMIHSLSIPILDDLLKGSQICLEVLRNSQLDRIPAVQSMLSSPYREDAWHLVYEIDSNMFSKCRIILIRLRIYFLLMHQLLTNDMHPRVKSQTRTSSTYLLTTTKKRRLSNLSISNNRKHGKFLNFKV